MGYRVDFGDLDALFSGVNAQASAWQQQLQTVNGAASALAVSTDMTGSAADSVRAYMEAVHGSIISMFSELISTHAAGCFAYKTDYQGSVDTALHAVIEETELQEIRARLKGNLPKATGIDDEVSYALGQVSDLLTVSHRGIYGTAEEHRSLDDMISRLDESIRSLESRHASSDFTATDTMISALRSMISEMAGKGRSYKSGFTVQTLAQSTAFADLYAAHLALQERSAELAPAIEAGQAVEERRMQLAQEEYEAELARRQREANTLRWAVTGLCVVGSIAAIALTGGAATPLVIGAVSAVSGATIAGTNNLADQYIATGDLSQTDWSSFGRDVLIGGVTGFVTGYAGAAVSGAITSGLSSTAVGSSLLNSSSAMTRIGTGAVIGSVSEVSSGIVSRGAGTYISSGGDLDAALEDAFDAHSILYDAAVGGVSGGLSHAKRPVITDGSQFDENGQLKPDVTYQTGEHEYRYTTDSEGRISEVHADDLQMGTHEGRLSHNPNTPGKQTGDQAGHLIGDRFGGSPELDNLTSQNGRLNQSDYKILENEWADAVENGQKVSVDIHVDYPAGSARPSSYTVDYTIDGEAFTQVFFNN